MGKDNDWKYDAFISYRHLDPDDFVAKLLHKKLEAFRLPKNIRKNHPELKKRIERVFRDEEELPLASNLFDPITEALKNSDNLIVICTPKLKESKWCLKEIETFIEFHGREHVFTALVEGEPDEVFPDILTHDENGNPVEPLAADFRGNTHREIEKKLDKEVLRLLAPMFGLNFDELKQRHKEQRMRRIITLGTILLALTTAMGIYYGITAYKISKQAKLINDQKNQIVNMASEIEAEYMKSLEKYEISLSGIAEDILADGRKKDALAILYNAAPLSKDSKEKPYCARLEKAMSNILQVYDSGNLLSPQVNYECGAAVISLDVSPDEKYIAARDETETINIFEVATGEKIKSLDAKGTLCDIHFLSETELIYNSSEDFSSSVKIYDIEKDKSRAFDTGSFVTEFVVSPDKKRLMAADFSNIRMFVLDNEKESSVLDYKKDGITYYDNMKYSEDSSRILVVGKTEDKDLYLEIFDSDTGERICITELNKNYHVNDIITDGDTAYIGGYELDQSIYSTGFIEAIDINSGKILWDTTTMDRSFKNLQIFTIDDRKYVFGNDYDKAYSIDCKTGECLSVSGTLSPIIDVYYSTDAGYALLVEKSGGIAYFSVSDGFLSEYYEYSFDIKEKVEQAVYKNKKMYLYQKDDTYITMYKKQEMDDSSMIGQYMDGYILSDDGKTLYCLNDKCLDIAKASDGSPIASIQTSAFGVNAINGGEDGVLLIDSENYTAKVYDLESGTKSKEYNLEKELIVTNKVNNNGNVIISYSFENKTNYRFMNVLTGEAKSVDLQQIYDEYEVSADFQYIAAANQKSIDIYNMNSGKKLKTIDINNGMISKVFFSNDSKYFLVMLSDNEMYIYSAEDFELVTKLDSNYSSITRMKYIEDMGYYLIVGTESILLNENLEEIADMYSCRGYSNSEAKLLMSANKKYYTIPVASYDEVLEQCEKLTEGYEIPEWIYSKYNISDED